MTLSALLSERASKYPKKICIKFENRKISYFEADQLVSLIAGGLRSVGLNDGDRAAILMENCPEYIIAYFAILRAGGIAVPVNTFLTPDEISYILEDSGCSFLIYSSKFSQHTEEIKSRVRGVRPITFADIPQHNTYEHNGKDSDVAVLLYTSGTTGFPKGAMLTHNNLISNAEASMKAMDVTSSDRILLFLPLFHSFSFTVCVILPVFAGASIVLLESVRPFSKVISSIIRDRITLFVAVPTVYNILSRKKISLLLKYLLRFILNVRLCISGAAPLPADTLDIFEKKFNVPLLEGYGLTEASPVVAVNPLKGAHKPASVGLPVSGVEVAVIGEDGSKVPAGQVGEIAVRGPNVMQGYFNMKEETEKVIREGWLYTGDLGKTDEEGYIYIVDRKKDVIISDGMNIYPREIEEFMLKHNAVDECAMVGIPDGKGSENTVLFIKKKENESVDETDIRKYFKGRIARFKIPKKIIFADNLPKTATGKIKKTELRKWKV